MFPEWINPNFAATTDVADFAIMKYNSGVWDCCNGATSNRKTDAFQMKRIR